jgi:hypothetical protein
MLPSQVRTKKAVIGSHGDKNTWLKLCKRQIQSSYHRSRCGHAEMNEATARQDGNRNESTQTQRFDKNTALVNQDGNVNVAIQDQRTLTNMAEGSEAIIRQNGNFNKAEQMQKERTTMRTRW